MDLSRKCLFQGILLFFLFVVFIVVLYHQLDWTKKPNTPIIRTSVLSVYDRKFIYPGSNQIFTPFQGKAIIDNKTDISNYLPDTPNLLDGMTVEDLAEFRMEMVKTYRMLTIFQPDYHPLKYYHSELYTQITRGEKWTYSASFFIANPYQLIVLTNAGSVTPVNMMCPEVQIVYHDGVIREIHEGDNAECWFNHVFILKKDYLNQVWPIMVNAWDAGFPYMHVDLLQSVNVLDNPDPLHITNTVYTRQYVYHEGKGGNNLSPASPKAYVTLDKKNMRTIICMKLWRRKPSSPQHQHDLTYIIDVTGRQQTNNFTDLRESS
ncbi:hypothetical protein K8T06_02530 [bacterium]|nr:hypothetical protein [bacterium]